MNMTRRTFAAAAAALPVLPLAAGATSPPGLTITRADPALDAVLDPAARGQRIATGLRWAEGPAWSRADGHLLFSDVPGNVVHRWSAADGAAPFLDPSGVQGPVPNGIREPGANGLTFAADGMLLIADSGTRAIVRVDPATKARTVLADRYDGKRLNSPNDLVFARSGALYFTDPPYGLEGGDDSALRELDWNGVYRLDPDGRVTLLDRTISKPNGIALSRDERTLYVNVSDPDRPVLLALPIGADGRTGGPRVLHDFAADHGAGLPGLPDGMKVDTEGRLYVTAPGGVHILSADGRRRLGLIATGEPIANVGFGEDGATLFLTANHDVWRLPVRARGWR